MLGIKPNEPTFRYGHISPSRIPGFEQAHILSLKGATAAGFRPKSDKMSSFARAMRAIRRLDPDVVCFGFGQVDAELSCYYMALRDGTGIQEALDVKSLILNRYLCDCMRAAKGRQLVIKGLNTSTLHETKALHRMLLRKFPDQLQMPRRQVAKWLVDHDVTVTSHHRINTAMAAALHGAAAALGLPYFDLRGLTGTPEQPGLTRPEFCGRRGDVHLADTAQMEAAFAEALANSIGKDHLLCRA
ncbi:hypothetical protein [Roseovarius sp. MBR-154]